MSYTHNETLAGVVDEVSYGGPCTRGLRMDLSIAAIPTEPTTTTASPTSPTTEMATEEATQPLTDTISSTMEGFSGESSSEPTVEKATTDVQLEILPSREIRDWHIGVVVTLSIAIIIVAASFIIVIVVVAKFCRRGGKVVADLSEEKIVECNGSANVAGTDYKKKKREYPTEIFEDPLN